MDEVINANEIAEFVFTATKGQLIEYLVGAALDDGERVLDNLEDALAIARERYHAIKDSGML